MIIFEEIKYRNFLSVGNNPITINLQRSPTTLITGSNGTGKSTLTCALTFALFGKSYRGVSKPSLVNTINQKGLEVECTFKIGADSYKIHRGIKPNIFDIYKNDKKLDNDAAVRDQQKYLEQQILKSDFKSFCQVIIIGTASYVPFMKLSAGARREFIENLLGISVFSNMNKILNTRISSWKHDLDKNSYNITNLQNQIDMQQSFIEKMERSDDEYIKKKKQELSILKKRAASLVDEKTLLEKDIEERQNQILNNELHELQHELSEHKENLAVEKELLRNSMSELKFFENNSLCPTCSQDISEDHTHYQINSYKEKADIHSKNCSNIVDNISTLGNRINAIQTTNNEIETSKNNLATVNATIEEIAKSAKVIISEIDSVNNQNKEKQDHEKSILNQYLGQRSVYENQYKELIDEKEIHEHAARLLKDTGIKSKIIKQYIPIINNSVNRYLSILGFNIVFELDENFNETLKARYKDEFTYSNLSMGERQRLDLAIMFAWRDVARQKNSTNMNILFLDETFDSSLDSQGTEDLGSILKIISKNTNVFVISHKGLSDEMFRSMISFEKRNGFTQIMKKAA